MKKSITIVMLQILIIVILYGCQGNNETRAPENKYSADVLAAKGLLQRLLPDFTEKFVFEKILKDSNHDVFEIESKDNRIIIRGNNPVSMASGLNWYLKYVAQCDVSLFGSQLDLPKKLPQVKQKIRQVSQDKYRYMLNYCSFGYSMVWYDWPQWEKLIDWMALNGINMPLSVTGQEAVWRNVGKALGINDLSDFFAGPPYLPFGWMGCLDGWGGPLPDNWIDAHLDLQKKILARERELGMTPVLQGFTGHIPPAIKKKFPGSNVQKIHWIDWETWVLDPMDPLFQKIGHLFLNEQSKLYGTDHLYAADTFIEMQPPSGDPDYLNAMAKSILQGMTGADPDAVWILQGWAFSNNRKFWTPERLKAFLTAVPNEHIILLDLFCEQVEMWKVTESFYGKPWMWCNIQTFGANVDMHGPLNRVNSRLHAARTSQDSQNLTGIGFVNEGLEGNPIAYEFLTEQTWHSKPVDVKKWLDTYALARYGISDKNVILAWEKLLESVYSDSLTYNVFLSANRYPRMNPGKGPTYNTAKVVEAWELLLNSADKLQNKNTYAYDLVSVGIQVLANYSTDLHHKMIDAFENKDLQRLDHIADVFIQVIRDMDDLAATHEQFLLGKWLEDAKRWGTNDADNENMEWNARRILTVWGSSQKLRDYSRRFWSGMLDTYYLPRWEYFIHEMKISLQNNKPFDEKAVNEKLFEMEKAWTEKRDIYPTITTGSYIDVSRKMWEKYKQAH